MQCWFCSGRRKTPKTYKCNDCSGKCKVIDQQTGRPTKCFACGGRGKIVFYEPCPVCNKSELRSAHSQQVLSAIRLDEQVDCASRGVKLSADECITNYTDATALDRKDDPCNNCVTGCERRVRFASGQVSIDAV